MGTIILLLVAIGIVLLIKFFYDKSQQSTKVAKEGGMLHKYRILIDLVKSGHAGCKVFRFSSDSVQLGVSSPGGITMFYLTQTFGTLTVQWKLDSPFYGKHNLEWTFDEYMDQEIMVEKINNDLTQYQINVLTAPRDPEL